MADLTVSAAMEGLINVLWAPEGWPNILLWVPNGWHHGGFSFVYGSLKVDRTFYFGRLTAGLTEVSPFQLNLSSCLWVPDGWPHLLLWAPDGWPHRGSHPHQPVILSTPTFLLLVRSDRCPELSVCLGEGGFWLNHFPHAHLRFAVLSVSAAATSATSVTKSCSILGLRVLITAPVPGSPAGCLCSDAIM